MTMSAGVNAPVVALAGPPNVGKSTLFNALTGARATMGNWPGTTVEVSRGVWHMRADGADAADGCGCGRDECRSHRDGHARSGDELAISLIDLPGAYSLDSQSPDEALTRELVVDAPDGEAPDVVVVLADATRLTHSLYLVSQLREHPRRVVVALTMTDVAARRGISVDAALLGRRLGVPVVMIDPRRRRGLAELARVVRSSFDAPVCQPRAVGAAADPDDERFEWTARAVEAATSGAGVDRPSLSDRVDRWVLAPVVGPLIFLVVMWAVFQLTTTVAAPLQTWLEDLFAGPVSAGVSHLFGVLGLGGSWVEGLLVDGIVAGVGTVLTFVPLMAIMFVLLALLEDSGYMARAAVVADRLMRSIGLPGRAFLPLIVGFGCNVPAITATRILPNARHRLLTCMLVPFTACSARLTVFVMMGVTFFGSYAGTAVFVMYVVSILLVVLVGLIWRKTLWRRIGAEPLVIDLPPYQIPTVRLTASVAWIRLKGFLRTAAGVVVAAVCAVWLLEAIPVTSDAAFGEVPVEDSAYGVAAQAITPVFEPTGFASWHTASALVVGFVAKEAIVSSWAQTYALEDDSSHANSALGQEVFRDFQASSDGHPLPAAWAFMVFLLAYTPCVATLTAQRREIGGKWTAVGVGLQLAVAWTLAVVVFQVGRLFW